jgi:hypothetical protein
MEKNGPDPGGRFIHRLGLYEVACRELLKLAQFNRLGKNQEWEFNEWVHNRTGRPMGTAYRAWYQPPRPFMPARNCKLTPSNCRASPAWWPLLDCRSKVREL